MVRSTEVRVRVIGRGREGMGSGSGSGSILYALALAVLLVLLTSTDADDTKPCSLADLHLFRMLRYEDGMIAHGVKLSGLRRYLPTRNEVDEIHYNKQEVKCNRLFRLALSKHLYANKAFTKHNGYPQDCSKPSECHRPSLGKYIRYNSIMQFHAFQGSKNDTLYDFQYSYGFRWSSSIPVCNTDGVRNSWECGFKPFSKVLEEQAAQLTPRLEKIDSEERKGNPNGMDNGFVTSKDFFENTALPHVDIIRRGKKNNGVQMLLYSRTLNLMIHSSEAAQKYIAERTVTLNPNVAANYFKEQYSGNITMHDSNTHNLGTFHRAPPSVSMHVRQGDSCDRVLNSTQGDMTNYITKTASGKVVRPCFSIDVYLRELQSLREKYGILRVYLSTDSQEMLQRIQNEPDFTWVYVNSSRSMLANRKGEAQYIDYLPSQYNEDVLFGGLGDLALLSKGDIFLGAFSSHFSKIAYFAMVGHHMRVLPFSSLDYSLECDTTDSCTNEDIKKRNLTMEALVTWAPECIRGVLPWSPSEKSDPCGIYN